MHVVRFGIRASAGVSLIALTLAAAPAFAGPAAATDAATPAVAAPVAGALVSGRVYDATGVALPGARIVVEGTGAEATTNLQGEFTVAAPDATGEVVLLIDYLGRPQATRTVTAAERGRAVSFTLPAAGANADGSGADIVVMGASLLDNTARALNQQRTADNTITVISADAIGRFPDPNIAEALQRAPGVGIERDQGEGRYINVRGAPSEFSAISVDGIQIPSVDPTTRAVDLDTLPSDIVANLEVTKSLLPSQDADSIAGAVNIATRSAFDRKGFALTGMAGASYNQFGKGSDYRASGAVSDTFGPDRQFGLLLSGSYSKTDRQPDNVENTWSQTPAGLRVTETLFKDYHTQRTRFAGTGALEWRPSDATRAWVRGTYARFEDDEYRDRVGILWSEGTLQAGSTDRAATYANTRIEKQIRHRKQVNEIWTATAGLEQRLGDGTIRVDGAYSESAQTYPRRDELLFRSSLRPTLSYDFANADLPRYSLFTSNEHLQTGTYSFRENTYRSNTTKNDELTLAVRTDLPVDETLTLSSGGKYRERHITADEERFRDRRASAAPSRSLAGFLSDQDSRNFDYDLGKRFDGGLADAYFDATKAASERRLPQSLTADYTAEETILGLFGMAKYVKDGTTLIAGLRVETTDFQGQAPSVSRTGAVTTALGKTGYTDYFPNVTLRQAFTPEPDPARRAEPRDQPPQFPADRPARAGDDRGQHGARRIRQPRPSADDGEQRRCGPGILHPAAGADRGQRLLQGPDRLSLHGDQHRRLQRRRRRDPQPPGQRAPRRIVRGGGQLAAAIVLPARAARRVRGVRQLHLYPGACDVRRHLWRAQPLRFARPVEAYVERQRLLRTRAGEPAPRLYQALRLSGRDQRRQSRAGPLLGGPRPARRHRQPAADQGDQPVRRGQESHQHRRRALFWRALPRLRV
ncbi:MAG: TonB-dependent receptor plug domain-containing protein [Sphingomonas taxi]